jgi:hypothetical protein
MRVMLQMCCEHVGSPQQAQSHRLPLLLPDATLLLPVRRQQEQQQQEQVQVQGEQEQQCFADEAAPSSSSVASAEIKMWSSVGSCNTGDANLSFY